MKKLNVLWLGLCSAVLLFGVGSANAEESSLESAFANLYAGVEATYQQMSGAGDFNGVVNPNYYNGGVYIGTKFYDNWGLEIGYNSSTARTQSKSFAPGSTEFNTTLTAGQNATLKTKVTLSTFYLDILGYMPINRNWNVIGTIGAGLVRAKIRDNGSVGAPPAVVNALQNVNSYNTVIARLGVGPEFRHKHFGIRGKVFWENTCRLRLQSVGPNVSQTFLKDSFGLAIGATYYF